MLYNITTQRKNQIKQPQIKNIIEYKQGFSWADSISEGQPGIESIEDARGLLSSRRQRTLHL